MAIAEPPDPSAPASPEAEPAFAAAPLTPRDPAFAERVRASFARQTFMTTLGAELVRVAPGAVDIGLGFHDTLLQQHGTMHAGALIAIADTAAGYSAMSLVAPGAGVVTAELKINMLNPGRAGPFLAAGRVIKSGRQLIVCRSDVFGGEAGEVHLLTGLFTMIQVHGIDD